MNLSPFSLNCKIPSFFSHFFAFIIINIAGILPQCFQDHLTFHSQTDILKDKLTGLNYTIRALWFVEGWKQQKKKMGAVPLQWLHPCICYITCL